jgi:hypothetical protein
MDSRQVFARLDPRTIVTAQTGIKGTESNSVVDYSPFRLTLSVSLTIIDCEQRPLNRPIIGFQQG